MFEPRRTSPPTEWYDDEVALGDVTHRPAGSDIGLLGSMVERPQIRARLHTICALYAHAPTSERRTKLLDELEIMALQVAATMAEELLEAGWTPNATRR